MKVPEIAFWRRTLLLVEHILIERSCHDSHVLEKAVGNVFLLGRDINKLDRRRLAFTGTSESKRNCKRNRC